MYTYLFMYFNLFSLLLCAYHHFYCLMIHFLFVCMFVGINPEKLHSSVYVSRHIILFRRGIQLFTCILLI